MLTDLDRDILLALNKFAQPSPLFGAVIAFFNFSLVKAGGLVTLFWWAMRNKYNRMISDDLFFVKTMVGSVLLIAVGRGLQNFLPARARPLHDPSLDFQPLFYQSTNSLQDWSSFPSDHAVLLAGLATAAFIADRRIGAWALAWMAVVSCFPRVALGMHYPSDILVGAAIGIAGMAAIHRLNTVPSVVTPLMRLEDKHGGFVYAIAFLFSFFCATLFNDVRRVLDGLSVVVLLQ